MVTFAQSEIKGNFTTRFLDDTATAILENFQAKTTTEPDSINITGVRCCPLGKVLNMFEL